MSHLPFVGGRRQTEFGPIDGLFYGVVSGTGDASGGNFTLNGNISFDRKEDWIYLLKKISSSHNADSATQEGFYAVGTGPLIPTPTIVQNASFQVGGPSAGIAGNAITVQNRSDGDPSAVTDIPLFGDKKIPGVFQMVACAYRENIDGAVYQLSVYGWLLRYESFFRNLSPFTG